MYLVESFLVLRVCLQKVLGYFFKRGSQFSLVILVLGANLSQDIIKRPLPAGAQSGHLL